MKRSEEKKERMSESFIIGVVAVVFLAVGYQTALFIHRAAVLKVVADRDMPDTVYVFESMSEPSEAQSENPSFQGSGEPVRKRTTVRRNASHHPLAESVRSNFPVRKVENFPFDPNTVTVDELCRLGFSLKQAQSIDNYRIKGGRFRRKEDFAKSYVVSDSIFRRLEPYIDIPLVDLNLADSADFDALPGIGGWFASAMVRHRNELGGYSYKEQLMDIWRFDSGKYSMLEDLVTVSEEGKTPYPLWSLPADSLRKHPYVGGYETARSIVLYRENNPPEAWTVDGLLAAGVLSEEAAGKLSRCLLR